MTDLAQPVPARWYCMANNGLATLCANEQDARTMAEECDASWPKNAPHRAVLLGDVADLRRENAELRRLAAAIESDPTEPAHRMEWAKNLAEPSIEAARAIGESGGAVVDQVGLTVRPSTLSAFLEALNGRRGDLDAWLECNNEAEVRAHVLALVKEEREKCAKICDRAAERAWSRWDLLAMQFDQGGAFEADKIADEIRKTE